MSREEDTSKGLTRCKNCGWIYNSELIKCPNCNQDTEISEDLNTLENLFNISD
jgi:predicted Zn-ribbon and HTH transcriptional regulator